jgi:outer membrane protein
VQSRAKFLAAVAAVGLFSAPVQGEDLKEALVAAYESNPDLAAARAQLRALDEDVARANSGWRPDIGASGSYDFRDVDTRSSPPTGPSEEFGFNTEDRDYSVQIRQPLFTGFRTTNTVKVAKKTVFAGRERLRQTEIDVLLDTVTSYMDVNRDEAVLGLNQNQVEVLRRQLKATQDRFDVGELTRTDVAQSEARLAVAITNRTGAEGQLTASREAYRRVVGRSPGTLASAPGLPPVPATIDEAINVAMKASPVIGSAAFNVEAAQAQVALAKSGLWPTVNANASFNRSEGDTPFGLTGTVDQRRTTKSIGASVSIPLYQSGAEYAEIRRAMQVESQRRMELSSAERVVEEQVRNAWEQLRTARSSIESSQSAVNANEIALEGVRQEATVGSRTILDVLDAEQELLDSRVQLARAQRNEYVAGAGLLAAIGQLGPRVFELAVQLYDPTEYYENNKGRFFGW